MDEQGFPLDENYLREHGLNLVDLNRELVNTQEMNQQLLQVLSDPTQRAEFLAALDGNNTQVNDPNAAQPLVQRQSFPGGAPGTQSQPQSLEDTYNYLQALTQMGTPIDQMAYHDQMWSQLNEQNVSKLAETLIRGAF